MEEFAVINFNKCFKSVKEEQNVRKVTKLLFVFLTASDEVEKYVKSNSFDNCIHLYNNEIQNFLIQNYN